MPFSDKLHLLMKVQNVSNSRLAKALLVDASLISRWRTGARNPAKNNDYIRAIALYFSEQARHDYQKSALHEIIGIPLEMRCGDVSVLTDYLASWLSDELSSDTKLVDQFLDNLDLLRNTKVSIPKIDVISNVSHGVNINTEIFYGIAGMRQGVIRFLSKVLEQNKPCTLLLYSDENIEWLTEDRSFFMKWASMLIDILSKGYRIKIIHTITRDLCEMLTAIDKWMPVYMTGAIEPYYYPKYRENIFRRTMFIAPDIAALTASALSEHSNNSAHFYYEDRNIITNLTDEFNLYVNMCRPLMQIFTGSNIMKFTDMLVEYEEQTGDCISLLNSFSSATIPEKVYYTMVEQANIEKSVKDKLIELHKKRFETFKVNIRNNKHTEVIIIHEPLKSADNYNLVCFNDFYNAISLYYSFLEYCEHIENIISLLKNYDNYNIILSKKSASQNRYLSTKEDVGAIVAKNDISPIIFAFKQPNMTFAFTSYLEDIIKEVPPAERRKEYTIKVLTDLVRNLKQNFKAEFY